MHASNPIILFSIFEQRRNMPPGTRYGQQVAPRYFDQPERAGLAGVYPRPSAAGALAAREDSGIDRRAYCSAFGSWRNEYDVRDHTLTPGRFTSFTSILRVRLSGSGLVDEYPST